MVASVTEVLEVVMVVVAATVGMAILMEFMTEVADPVREAIVEMMGLVMEVVWDWG